MQPAWLSCGNDVDTTHLIGSSELRELVTEAIDTVGFTVGVKSDRWQARDLRGCRPRLKKNAFESEAPQLQGSRFDLLGLG